MNAICNRLYKRVIYLILFAAGLFSTNLYAQDDVLQKPDVDIIGTLYIPLYHMDNSPFIKDEWLSSDLLLCNGKLAHVRRSKFDHYRNSYVYYNENLKRVLEVEPASIEEFTFYDRLDTLHFVRHNTASSFQKLEEGMFIQLLCDGKYRFCIFHVSYIQDPRQVNEKAQFIYLKDYFVQIDGKVTQIRLKRKSILQLFPEEEKKELTHLMNQLRVRKRNEDSFVRFFEALNQR